jgi:hypothetical protein
VASYTVKYTLEFCAGLRCQRDYCLYSLCCGLDIGLIVCTACVVGWILDWSFVQRVLWVGYWTDCLYSLCCGLDIGLIVCIACVVGWILD